MKLLIVESPSKAKTIQKYLSGDWSVAASVGHIRDLPANGINVDRKTLKPHYEVTQDKRKQVSKLKSLASSATDVYLATDPDREGEAISWHLAQVLRLKDPLRVTYQEVTEKAIKAAIASPRSIDYKLVAAQECRRVLDRVVGYTVSPALSRKAQHKRLSAGRVQSVAVRLVADLEREIKNFVSKEHYKVTAHFSQSSHSETISKWQAQWNSSQYTSAADNYLTDRALAEEVSKLTSFTKVSEEKKRTSSAAPKPFTTSTLQQAASVKYKISPKKSMQIAQALYEGGHITYHRTDSVSLSDEAIEDIRDWLTNHGLQDAIPSTPNKHKSKGSAQEAHEAVRPTSISNRTVSGLSPEQAKVYELIWNRTVASQMTKAEYDVTSYILKSVESVAGQQQEFIAKGRVLVSAGWLQLTEDETVEDKKGDNPPDDNQTLPPLADGKTIDSDKTALTTHNTKPPGRFTQAGLIKAMEAKGVGRPSTYASIMDLIVFRKYVEIKANKLHATNFGMGICELLVPFYSFLDVSFTATVEKRLDSIARGDETYKNLTGSLWDSLDQETSTFSASDKTTNLIKAEEGAKPGTCPICKDETLTQIYSKKTSTHWWVCESKCDIVISDYKSRPLSEARPHEGYECEGCGGRRVCRLSKKGKLFWVCGSDKCNDIYPDIDGKPVKPTTFPCGCENNGQLRAISGSKGTFWGCSEYNAGCMKTYPDKDGKPDLEYVRPEVKTFGKCPKCKKGDIVQRTKKADKSVFYSCNAFPKCKHASNDPPEDA